MENSDRRSKGTMLVGSGSEGSSDDEAEPEIIHQSLTSSEKRRARNANFHAWVRSTVESDIKEQIQREAKNLADEELSIRDLLARQETTAIITDPREYQIELFERAKQRNTIAVLDTGSGKTLIAVLLLRHVIDQELEDRMAGKAPRIACFLVPSVTLVFQQFAVLERNLDHKVERFFGAMNCNLWSRDTWQTYFEQNKVIVCTADVLLQCLMHSFINIRQINLLIFDEAHHAKKNHSYAQIVKDFYLQEADVKLRPRIFGMTASPVDAKVDVVQAASSLEDILCSQIATTANLALLQQTVNRPKEEIMRYPAPSRDPPPRTSLSEDMVDRFGELPVLHPLFKRAREYSTNLGRWPADLYWTIALAEKRQQKITSKIERSAVPTPDVTKLEKINQELEQIKDAIEMVHSHTMPKLRLEVPEVSQKVVSLYRYLSQYFERPSDHRCIVFVEQRATAWLLRGIFEAAGGPHLRAAALTGSGSERADDMQATFRHQVVTLVKFRKGLLNCLFATSVAEEGLDVPDCNLVIRFDACKTMIQYVQSRGRARRKHSKFLHMVEVGNSIQERILHENRFAEVVMRKFCESLPADRRLDNDESNLFPELSDGAYVLTVPSTGATLTLGSSLAVLAHFVGSLQKPGDDVSQPRYITTSQADKFICEVILPETCPLPRMIGDVSSSKSLAKRTAAFKACVYLHHNKALNENLVPAHTKKLPAMRNAALGLSMKKGKVYPMRLKPWFWAVGRGAPPTMLYFALLDIPDGLDRPHQPLLLLTRAPLPELPAFPLFLNDGRPALVQSRSFQAGFHVSDETLIKLTVFTLRIFEDVFNKEYEAEDAVSKMTYWIAPAHVGAKPSAAVQEPWTLIDETALDLDRYKRSSDFSPDMCDESGKGCKWTPDTPTSFLLDKFFIDKWDGGRRFFSTRIAPEHKPLDAVPTHSPPHKWMANILDYSISLWAKARKGRKWNTDQPVVEVDKVLHRRNLLAHAMDKEEIQKSRCFICPEPFRISALPTRVVATCYVFPAMIHRIDSYLTAIEVFNRLELTSTVDLALEAVTKDSDNSEDHQTHERINFQRGMGKNYERLEFLGDCFLKMATSIAVFTQNPNDNEFDFHVKRMLLLCNQNLFNVAQGLNLYEAIRSREFQRRTWYPEGLRLLKGKGAQSDKSDGASHVLGDKTIADVCEAIIGAAFLTHNQPGEWEPEHWDNAVKAVTKLVCSGDHTMMRWTDYSKSYDIPVYQTAPAQARYIDLARKVEEKHDYHFRHHNLLGSTFLHPSWPMAWSGLPSYQRLEFLGDSLLDMACITHLFYRYPDKDPQWLTEHKMAMVSNRFLGALCVKIGFHVHLLYQHEQLGAQINAYVDELKMAEKTLQGAIDVWTTVKDPPKCLPDMIESYVGAAFIDSNFDYRVVQHFFDRNIKPYFEDMSIYDTFANNHPVTRLYNVLRDNFGCDEFQLLVSEEAAGDGTPAEVVAGLMIHNHDKPIGAWRAKSGRYAKIKAAAAALEALEGLAPFEYRAKYGCNCHVEDGGRSG